jgi:hypothetical protein
MAFWRKRLLATVPALFLGWGIYGWFNGAHTRYWVLRDGAQSVAVITAEGSHGTVYYTYFAAGAQYAGRSHRDRDSQVGIGGRSPVWYSSSHPWLSSLPKPEPALHGFPWVVIASAFELLFLSAIIFPRRIGLFEDEPTAPAKGARLGGAGG